MKQLYIVLIILFMNIQIKAQSTSQQIKAIEYFIDNDPGPRNGNALVISENTNINETFAITIPSLSGGFHNLYIRVKDQNNSWSIAQRTEFYVLQALPQSIVKLQYYFDTDPGVGIIGNGAIIPVNQVSTLNQNISITIPGSLSTSYHNLFIRTQNEFGVWSIAERRAFGIGQCVNIAMNDVISWWSFDETSNTGITDISGNHNGVLLNGASTNLYTTFDGTDDYIGVPDSDDWAFGTNDFSIEFFANFLLPGGDIEHPEDKFIGQSEGGGVSKKWTFALGGGKLFLRVSDGSISQNLVQYNFSPVLNQWYHLALTRKSDTLRTYINGMLAGMQIVSGLSIPNVNAPLTIGAVDWVQGVVKYMDGKLDEMTLYKRALTQAEITSISNAGAGGKCKSVQITTPAISDAKYGTAFSQTMKAQLGTLPYTWSISSGDLPEGITLSSEGVLSGTSTEAGEFAFTVQAKDANDVVTQKEFVLKVLLTLPEPQFTIFKSGTAAVPGREMDYFALVENVSNVTIDSLSAVEFIDPWFHYISSYPEAEVSSIIPNVFTLEVTTDFQPRRIRWHLNSLMPGESEILSYKVKLDPKFPLNKTVRGRMCTEGGLSMTDCLNNCDDQATAFWATCEIGCFLFIGNPFYYVACMTTCFELADIYFVSCLLDCTNSQYPCALNEQLTGGAEDPNEKLVLADKYIQPEKLLPYVIHFENIGTIEARDVFIKDTLDEDLDETTLNILTPGGVYNPLTRVLKWDLNNINLLPDSNGYVLYTVKPKPNLPSGTVIHNTGHIQFEVFDVFATNETENIIDNSKPEGIMNALPATMYQTAFPISWSGMDAVGEIKNYTIFVSKNNEPYELYLSKTQNTTAIFTGVTGNSYSFICIAEDLAGNIEIQEPIAEATTYLDVLCTDVYYYDADNDGYGNNDYPTMSCSQPAGFVGNNTDCNDAVASINPGKLEICNFIDDDCDGLTDEGVTTTFYRDADADGFGNPEISLTTCGQPAGYVGNGNDCNDSNANINPVAVEIPDNKDNDCDGLIDEGFSDLSVDAGACKQVYRGYDPAACIALDVIVDGGTKPYTYLWSNGSVAASTTVCPNSTTVYKIVVTDKNGFSAEDNVTVHVKDIRCGANNSKVQICHKASNNILCIAPSAVQAHLNHGDNLGMCNISDPCAPTEQVMLIAKAKKQLKSPQKLLSPAKVNGDDSFIVRPNPANDQIEIQTIQFPSTISLIDVSGKLLLRKILSERTSIINTSSYENGIYFIRLENDTQCIIKSVLVMH